MSCITLSSDEETVDNTENKELKDIETELSSISELIRELEIKRKQLLMRKERIQQDLVKKETEKLSKKDWNTTDYPWSKELSKKLKDIFHIDEFRTNQLAAMNATMSSINTILIMPTGGGKSLCYQLPALLSSGITLVVCPLVSLMEDQLMHLKKLNVPASMFSASTTKEERNSIFKAMIDSKDPLKLLYVTPEKLAKSKTFMTKLQKMFQIGRFSRLAIDEVHCCSQWGHDFRPDYKFLGAMSKMFPKVPVLGLTATATSKVIADVQKMLNLRECHIIQSSFNRPNLFYEVRQKPASQKECVLQLKDLLNKEFKDQSGIIYTMTIKETEELTKQLREVGLKVSSYHANKDAADRLRVHQRWMDGRCQAVIATIAFGMGIDKPNVRFVVHHCISKSMENFYQESGRAGRDGKPAKCILFWRLADLCRQSTMVFTEQTGLENLYGIIDYCIDASRCRRSMIASHFDEEWTPSECDKMCDHCRSPKSPKSIDVTPHGRQIVQILDHADSIQQKMTAQKVIDAWLGKGPSNLRVKFNQTIITDRQKAETIFAFLLIDGYLIEDFQFTPYSTISYIKKGFIAQHGSEPKLFQIEDFSSSKKSKRSNSPDSKNSKKLKT